jgi:hypothetical protein
MWRLIAPIVALADRRADKVGRADEQCITAGCANAGAVARRVEFCPTAGAG